MKKTPLYKKHIELNATMVNFADFKMPIQYSSIFEEVKAVRKSVGLSDVSHMGEIEISGVDALDFVNWIITNDASKLKPLQAQYTTMLYPEGGIVDDLLVYHLPKRYLLVVNASNQEKDFEWIRENKRGNVEIKNRGSEYFQLAVQGPLALNVIRKVVTGDPSNLPFYWSREESINTNFVILSRTGYTGEDGFEIYGDSTKGEEIWDAVMEAGKEEGEQPCGLGARDLLRLEMGYCLYGNDITKDTTPLEAGLSWLVKMEKGDFIGKKALLEQKEEGIKRRLVGITVKGRKIPRDGYPIYKEGKRIGKITSGNYSPTLKTSIAMGYVMKPYHKTGSILEIEIRNKKVIGKVTELPFWKNGSAKK